ncbi:MAG TPA: ATP-binding protein [Terriglobia bacterium]|nr:ATP-binding protein [Terriglobia bacterium]
MRRPSVRVRLTFWYIAVLVVTFALFGTIAFYAMKESIDATVNEELRNQASGVKELIRRILPEGKPRIGHELAENSELRRGMEFLQVAGEQGRWIYRSPLMARYGVALRPRKAALISTLKVGGRRLRVLTESEEVSGAPFEIQVAVPVGDFEEALADFQWTLLLISPFLLLLASAGGYWMSRRALKPVDEITNAARRINPHNLSERLKLHNTGDELQRLSETLNGMLGRIEEAFKRITQFTADASHELRTPVALMRTTAEVSLRRPRSNVDYQEALTQILGISERTSALIEQLMLLARADSGFELVRHARLDLVNPFRGACSEIRALAAAKQIQFVEDVAASPIEVEGDDQGLRRLFLILLDNAVKYTPEGGEVRAGLRRADGFAVAEIRDTGAGIESSDLPHIFERFYRADKARATGGAGLGLSIGRWIAEAHGGKIEVESGPPRGCVFSIRLPIARG